MVSFIVSINLLQPSYSLRTFTGHSSGVMSLDFHPNKDDLICSCDGDGEIRYWSINNGSCSRVFKVQHVVNNRNLDLSLPFDSSTVSFPLD